MPFDDTSPRGWMSGPDPAPTWGERIAAWALLAALGGANALLLALIGLLGLAGAATGNIDFGGMALLIALVTYPMHLSWAKARALAAGRWP